MSKKRLFTEDEITKMVSLYNDDMVGTPSIGNIYGVDKSVINRVLKENGVKLGMSGRKFKGGKSEADKRYYENNKPKVSEYHSDWRSANKAGLKEYHKSWRLSNEDKVREYTKNYKDKNKDNPRYKLVNNTRSALWTHLKGCDITKYKSTFDVLGYTPDELMSHLETQFTDGMSWDNYGEWHVDHVIPMTNFSFDEVTDYEFTQCWGLNNLRPMWATTREVNGMLYEGNLNKGTDMPVNCYQYRIRERKRIEEVGTLSFNPSDCDLKSCDVRLIDKQSAKKLIEGYEWLSYMPSYTKYHFGVYFKIDGIEHLGGVVVFQKDYVENTGVWDTYGYSGKLLLLSRGVCLWWTPKNTATFLIAKALSWIEHNTDTKVITATVDSLAGEIGTIYQAANWVYVGVMRGNILNNGKVRERLGTIIDGNLYTSRQIRSMLGTMKKSSILEAYPDAKFVKQKAKSRYFYFLGDKRERLLNRSKLTDQIKPYPKRL